MFRFFRATDSSKEKLGRRPGSFGIEWLDKRTLQIGGHEFDTLWGKGDFMTAVDHTAADRFLLSKNIQLINKYIAFAKEQKPKKIIEFGVFKGGSVAFFSMLMKPEKLLAMELAQERVGKLDNFIAAERLDDAVRVEYGVNQADSERVRQLAVEHLGPGRPIDVVFDDASHLLGPTRKSFETLFPMIRHGGSYIVEDFASAQLGVASFVDEAVEGVERAKKSLQIILGNSLQADLKPCHMLAVEAMLASMSAPHLVKKVVVDREWLRIVRGKADYEDAAPFDLRALAKDHFGMLDSGISETLSPLLEH